MSKHRFEIEIEVDDEALAAHDGNEIPPPNEVDEWDVSDLVKATILGLFNPHDAKITDYTCISE